jgi:hypothetical protein
VAAGEAAEVISTIRRKLARGRRDLARGPLDQLVRFCAVHAMTPYAGRDLTADLMATCTRAVERELAEIADRGAFRYFGIADARALGVPPVELYVFDDGAPPYGKVAIDAVPVVAWVLAGGARGQGWRSADQLVSDDLV